MDNTSEYYIIDKKALPEVFIKVAQVKKLLEQNTSLSVQDATDKIGVSRSAYYKYKDFISELSSNSKGKTVIIAFNLTDEAGLLSNVLNIMANNGANVLTINQTIPINSVANVTVSIEISHMAISLNELMTKIRKSNGVIELKIIARE